MEAQRNISIHNQYWGSSNSNIPIEERNMFRFPNLPYSYSAIKNIADVQHLKNHFENFHLKSFEELQQSVEYPKVEKMDIEMLFKNKAEFSKQLIDIAGTIYNHQMYWDNLSPYCGKQSGELINAIEESFGNIFHMKEQFLITGMDQECCGWLWMIVNPQNKLELVTTKQNTNPLMSDADVKDRPLMAIDLWEHAYAGKFPNNKEAYLNNVWMYINWNEISKRFE